MRENQKKKKKKAGDETAQIIIIIIIVSNFFIFFIGDVPKRCFFFVEKRHTNFNRQNVTTLIG